EADEDNNRASATLPDPANTLDLEITPADVSASSTDLVIGTPLTVTAVVHNHGTADAPDVVVQLGLTQGTDVSRLTETHVSIPAGASAVATLVWTTSVAGDPLPLVVRADPFGTLTELSESNNDAALSVHVRASDRTNLRLTGQDVTFDPPAPREGTSV